ncbi:energy transducer TonB [Corallincola platygyrae]|uniref:Protein TonB n=1 Tax=Corallincola platygyrae TaxID=1193278 RepID=A0ABW4XM82_9GAMM
MFIISVACFADESGGTASDNENKSDSVKPRQTLLPIVRIEPKYPTRAAREGIEGYVVLKIVVDETGSTKHVDVIESSPEAIFDKAARKAVMKWKWKPAIVNGKAEEQSTSVKLTFELAG